MKRKVDTAETARVFFALWPDDAVRHALHDLATRCQERCAGRRMRADTLHMTLLFLGDMAVERLPDLMQAASGVSGGNLVLELEQLACWKHNRIAYAAPNHVCEALGQLESGLRAEVGKAGFGFDQRAFRPHVTLLRNVERVMATEAIPALRWEASSFVLVQSELTARGASYRVLQTYPLGSSSVTSVPPSGPAA